LSGVTVIASEAKQSGNDGGLLDCFVASLLAMTDGEAVIASEAKQSRSTVRHWVASSLRS
jgi:hypothetical protein